MKYVATVELEFTTPSDSVDPLDAIKHFFSRLEFVDHYHIIEQPRQLRKAE